MAYGISPRSRCGLSEPRQRGRPVHNPEPDIAGFTPKRSGPPRPGPAFGTGRFRCYTANQVDSFVGHVPLFPRDFSIPRAVPCKIRAGRCNRTPGQMPLAGRGARAPAMASEGIWPVALFWASVFSVRDSGKLTLDVGNHESRKIPPSPVATTGTLIMVISVRRVNGREPAWGEATARPSARRRGAGLEDPDGPAQHPGRREPGRRPPRCAVHPLQRAGRHHGSASQCHDLSPRRRMPAGVETAGTHRT